MNLDDIPTIRKKFGDCFYEEDGEALKQAVFGSDLCINMDVTEGDDRAKPSQVLDWIEHFLKVDAREVDLAQSETKNRAIDYLNYCISLIESGKGHVVEIKFGGSYAIIDTENIGKGCTVKLVEEMKEHKDAEDELTVRKAKDMRRILMRPTKNDIENPSLPIGIVVFWPDEWGQ